MAHNCFQRVLHATVDTFRDGGFHGWMAVLGLFVSKMAWIILVKGLGMMLPTLQEQFATSTWLIGWMVAITEGGALFAGFLATPLKERFGARTVLTVSGLIAGISMIIASLVSSLYVITLILTLLTGPAIGIPFVMTKHLIGCYFTKSATTAYAVGTLGSSLVFVTVVPLIQLFLDTYGWRGTMLLLGGLLLHLAVCGALMKPPTASGSQDGYEAAHTDDDQEAVDDTVVPSNRFGCSCCTTVYSFARDKLQLGLFSSMSFWLVTFIGCVWILLHSAWIIYYVQYNTVYKEFTLEDTSHFIIAFGIGRTVACLVIGPLVQKVQVVGPYTWFGVALLLPAIYYAVDPWLTSFWPITANAFVLGNAISMCTILESVVLKEVYNNEQLGYAIGSTALVAGMANLLSLYFPGLIYDTTGEYTLAFSLMAGLQSLTVVALLLLYWRQKRRGTTVPPP